MITRTTLIYPSTMATNATIYKAQLQIADMDRRYFRDHALTLARHPSETDERLMVRVLAFALHADDALSFGRGVVTEDEPALWQRDLTGVIDLWIEIGQPDEKTLRRACGRAKQVVVYSYGARDAEAWWADQRASFDRLRNLSVTLLPMEQVRALAEMASPSMQLQWTIQDGHVWIAGGTQTLHLELQRLKS
ncbi:MAG: YaeQ family protein [Nitrospira sp.]|nr:YaeQ family protein [Nitrospira sp.]